MAPKNKGVGLLVLAVLALLLLLAKPKKPPAPAVPGGNIAGVVTLSQGNSYQARAHLVVKGAGDALIIGVTWTAETTNSLGQPINWNYGISYRFRQSGTPNITLAGGWANIGSFPNGTHTFTFNNITALSPLNYPAFAGKTWDVQVALHADRSSGTGEPLGDMAALEDNALLLANGEHLNAFRVV